MVTLSVKVKNCLDITMGNQQGGNMYKNVDNYGPFAVSEAGVVINRYSGHVYRPEVTKGYFRVNTTCKGLKLKASVHRLVALAYLDNPENFPIINHKDGDKLNNHKDNLEWCTASHNQRHAIDTGLRKIYYGEDTSSHVISENTAMKIVNLLLENKSVVNISRILNVKREIIKDIKAKKSWKLLTENLIFAKTRRGKISDSLVIDIKIMLSKNINVKEIHNITGVSESIIYHIKAGKAYKHITPSTTNHDECSDVGFK